VTAPQGEGEARELIGRCLAGDSAAQVEFQRTYGQLIYEYPIRQYRMPAEAGGDFYVFAFDRDRIFRRLRTFEGRTSLRAYLLGCVLDHLVLEWKRGQRELEMVSIEALGELPDPGPEAPASTSVDPLADVPLEKAIVMKLVYIEDYELTATDVRYLASHAGRSVRDVLVAVHDLRQSVRAREAQQRLLQEALDAVFGWISLYERRLFLVAEELAAVPGGSTAALRLGEEQAALQRKLLRRQQQRLSLLARVQGRRVTAPYQNVAKLLNTTANNVAAQVKRLRRALAQTRGMRLVGSDGGKGA